MGNNCNLFFKETSFELDRLMHKHFSVLTSEKIALIVAEWEKAIRREMSGQKVYVTKGRADELSKRDQEIWQAFNGENRRDLCQKYNISEVRLYQIVKAVDARRNPKLPTGYD